MYKFDFCQTVSAPPQRVESTKHLLSLFSRPEVQEMVERFRAGDAAAKRRLPAVCFQAWYENGRRANANARPSGLFMIDIDHVENPRFVFDNWLSTGLLKPAGVVMVYITPSGHGLKVIARRCAADIPADQARLAQMLNTDYDTVAKDLARLAFVSKIEDVLYCDKEELENPIPFDAACPNSNATTTRDVNKTSSTKKGTQSTDDPSASLTYHGVKIRDIAETWLLQTGGIPEEGSRNTRLYSLARDLRYICDFNATTIANNIPHCGLSDEEVLALCNSAVGSTRRSETPAIISQIIKTLTSEEIMVGDESDTPELPPLPPVFSELVECVDDAFKSAAICALLPCLGTLGSRLRARYLDGEIHAPNFMTVIEAPQASGKSFTRRLVEITLAPIRLNDEIEREKERAFTQAMKLAKNKKDQPTDPRAVVRIIPASISIAKLLQRLDYAKGLHLFSFAEEIDTLVKSNRAGAWSQKTDIYRNAFDNAEYGQDYMSENSYSTIVRVCYNMLMCGTPRAVNRFYDDAENGLVSRSIFCIIPSQFGNVMPRNITLSEVKAKIVNQYLQKLYQLGSGDEILLNCNHINAALDDWLEKKRIEAIKSFDYASDIFRRRAAVVGFRAGMIAEALYGRRAKRNEENIIAFALWIADYMLDTLVKKFGNSLEEEPTTITLPGRNTSLFEMLPNSFTVDDVRKAQTRLNLKTPTRVIIYRWKKANFINKTTNNQYTKL
ncbi:MAG: DUF3987 domain-containing protein [Bacteroidaceae bacterium]|nr:DUF3987 domain-containing protein [Bacteroidaceae bacterium]